MTKSKMSTPMLSRVMGIDPGFDRCGVAILEKANGKERLLYSACIVTNRKSSHEERLLQIGTELERVVSEWQPSALAIEKLFFNVNQKTALKVSEARGVVVFVSAKHNLSFNEYSPQSIKIAVTGYGKATKSQVETMVVRILGLKTKPKHDDETDAVAVGITHLASTRSN